MHQQMAETLDTAIVIAEIAHPSATRAARGFAAPALADDRPAHAEGLDLSRRRSTARSARTTGARTRCRWARCTTTRPHVRILEQWMKSYRPEELFDADGRFKPELAELAPKGEPAHERQPARQRRAAAARPEAAGLPRLRRRGPSPRRRQAEATRVMGKFLRDVMKLNLEARNFRLFSPDENNSNRWQDVLEVTNRAWMARQSLTTTISRPTAG
jgi:phosphoketolase